MHQQYSQTVFILWDRVKRAIGLFSWEIGLFRSNTGLFPSDVGLCLSNTMRKQYSFHFILWFVPWAYPQMCHHELYVYTMYNHSILYCDSRLEPILRCAVTNYMYILCITIPFYIVIRALSLSSDVPLQTICIHYVYSFHFILWFAPTFRCAVINHIYIMYIHSISYCASRLEPILRCAVTNYMYIMYSLLHLECHLISISNLNLFGLFSTERGKRDLEN